MPYIPTNRRFDGIEEFQGPQRPSRSLWRALLANMFTELAQDAATTNSASPNYAYMLSPQTFQNASSFNAERPVMAPTPIGATAARRNQIASIL